MAKNSLISITTSPSICRYRRFSAPRSPYPWVWRCHRCRTVYRFSAALNRCLSCSHRFCVKCVSEFDYTGWQHWKSYWEVRSDGEGDKSSMEYQEGTKKVRDTKSNYEEILIEQSDTTALWDGFDDVTNLDTCASLEEQLQLQLNMNIDPALFTPTSSCPISPCASSYASSSTSGEEGDWEPSTHYLQRSAPVSALDAETHGLVLASQDKRIDPALKPGMQTQKTPYSDPNTNVYGASEEGETMRDWPLSTPSRKTGYSSVREARKALHPYLNVDYGTDEEGETMRDWSGVGYFSPDEVTSGGPRCCGDMVEEKDSLPLVGFENRHLR